MHLNMSESILRNWTTNGVKLGMLKNVWRETTPNPECGNRKLSGAKIKCQQHVGGVNGTYNECQIMNNGDENDMSWKCKKHVWVANEVPNKSQKPVRKMSPVLMRCQKMPEHVRQMSVAQTRCSEDVRKCRWHR